MELDTKQKVLLAIYLEYQKDLPEMKENIRAQALQIDAEVFRVAIEKLQNEGLVKDANISYGGNGPYPLFVITDYIKMTTKGINYVESKLNIEPTLTGLEKAKEVAKNIGLWGLDQFKDFSARVIGEIAGKAIGM